MDQSNPDVPRPFEPRTFRRRSLVKALLHEPAFEDACAALETRLAEQGVEGLSADEANSLLKQFGLPSPTRRPVLIDTWTKAFHRLFARDQTIGVAEASYLSALKSALGLSDHEVENQKAEIINPIFIRRASEILSRDDAHTAHAREQLHGEATRLGITANAEKTLMAQLTNMARATLTSILHPIFERRCGSPEEVESILSFMQDFGLTFEADEQNKLVRCWHLGLLEQGNLPTQKVDLLLAADETCSFLGNAVLFENRKVRGNPSSLGELRQVDTGVLYLTTEQILFVGQTGSHVAQYASLVRVYEDGEALVLQKQRGKTLRFVFPTNLDCETARRTIETICSHVGKKAEPAAPKNKGSELLGDTQSRESQKALTSQSANSESLEALLNELNSLTGLQPVKAEIGSIVNYLRVQRLRVEQGLQSGQITVHLVFTGNPGTGKTTVARLLAKLYKATGFLPEGHLIETDKSGLVGGYLGQTPIKTAEVIKTALGGILFIDEAYALARSPTGTEYDMYGTEAIDTLVKAMEDNRDRLVVIVAGYKEPMEQFLASNPGLRSRFTRYIDFPDYSPDELLTIFESMVKKEGYELGQDARGRLTAVLQEAYSHRAATFGNARLARTLFERAKVRLSDRLASDLDITRDELTTLHGADIVLLPSDTAT